MRLVDLAGLPSWRDWSTGDCWMGVLGEALLLEATQIGKVRTCFKEKRTKVVRHT